jgi:hypothetical protein
VNLIDDKLNAKAIARLLDTNRLTFEQVLPEMRDEVLILAASIQNAGFDEIPRSYHTPEIAAIAANTLAKSLNYGDVGNDYYQVATKLISDGIGLNYIHPDYVDSKLVLINLQREDEEIHASVRTILRKYQHLVNNDILNFVASRSLNYMDDLLVNGHGIKQLDSNSLLEGLIRETWMSSFLVEKGRPEILSMAIKDGHWPNLTILRPNCLSEAIGHRMKTSDEKSEEANWLNAFIANYPVAEVVSYMNTKSRRSVLMDIFPAEQLFEFVKHNKEFGGEFLERSMGL